MPYSFLNTYLNGRVGLFRIWYLLVGEKLFFLGRHRCSLLLFIISESMNLFTKVKEFSFLGRHRRSFIPFIFFRIYEIYRRGMLLI